MRIYVVTCFIALGITTSCDSIQSQVEGSASAVERSSARVQVQEQTPWRFTAQLLPVNQEYVEQASKANLTVEPKQQPPLVTTLKLRLQSQDPKTSIQTLFQLSAEQLSPSQQQSFLLYHLDEVAYLQIDHTRIRPVAAIVEMTPQRTEYLDVDFTFSLPPSQIRQGSDLLFVLEKAFFLSRPVEFSFPSSQLLAPGY